MKSNYLVIYPSGVIRWKEFDSADWFPRLYQVIGCDCVEMVSTVFPGISLVIDESGRVKNPPRLHNEIASRLYAGWLFGVDDIVGPAVVVACRPVPPFMELDWFPLDPSELARLSLYLSVPFPDKEVSEDA